MSTITCGDELTNLVNWLKKIKGSECIRACYLQDEDPEAYGVAVFIDMDTACQLTEHDLQSIVKRTTGSNLLEPYMAVGGKIFEADHVRGTWVVCRDPSKADKSREGFPLHHLDDGVIPFDPLVHSMEC